MISLSTRSVSPERGLAQAISPPSPPFRGKRQALDHQTHRARRVPPLARAGEKYRSAALRPGERLRSNSAANAFIRSASMW